MLVIKNMCIVGALMTLVACGSSGGGGSPTGGGLTVDTSSQSLASFQGASAPATVSVNNVESLSVGATAATKKVLDGLAAPIPSPVASAPVEQVIAERSLADLRFAMSQPQLPVGFSQVEQCSGGGSISINAPGIDENANSAPESGVIESVYTDCQEAGSLMDGYVVMSYSGGWNIDSEQPPRNYTITFDMRVEATGAYGYMYDVAGQMICSDYGNSCRFAQNFADGGINYRVESLATDDDNADYDVYARVYVGDEGYIEFTAWDITIENGQVCSGSILVTDTTGDDVLDVQFPSCNTMIVNYNGETYTYSQN